MRWAPLLPLLLAAMLPHCADGVAVGIDLGTTYSCVAVYQDGAVSIIPNEQGNRITPSWLAFESPSGNRLVGEAAKNQAAANPNGTVYDAKRLIGRLYDEKQLQEDIPHFPFSVVKGAAGKPMISVQRGETPLLMAPEEVSAMVLEKLKGVASGFVGEDVVDAVVTVPAYFNDAQRQATKDAGRIAGLNVLRVLNEPTAAAIAYGLDRKVKARRVLVFDLGGGTFDVSLLSIDKGEFRVLATAGDTHLGGADFDQRIMDWLVGRFQMKNEMDLTGNTRALAQIRREAEAAKRKLSKDKQVKILVESIMGGRDLKETLTRAKFEELCKDLFKKCAAPIKTVLDDTDTRAAEVDSVVLVGGSTRIPYIRKLVELIFKDNKPAKGVNPDEAVAYGAAVQAAVLTGVISKAKVSLFDVTPLSMGIKTAGNTMSNLINRNSPIPTKKEKVFTTFKDDQKKVKIEVYEGERALVKHNHFLGRFELRDIPPGRRGAHKFKVTFALSEEGILTVSAYHVGRGSGEQTLTIDGESGRLTEEEIKSMLDMAEQHKEIDAELRAALAARSALEQYAAVTLPNYFDDPRLEDREEMVDIDEALQAARDAIQDTLGYLSQYPDESKETYAARRAELQETATPVVEHVRQLLIDIEEEERKAAEAAEKGEDAADDEGDDEGAEGRDEDDL